MPFVEEETSISLNFAVLELFMLPAKVLDGQGYQPFELKEVALLLDLPHARSCVYVSSRLPRLGPVLP